MIIPGLDALKGLISAIGAIFGWIGKRSDLNNSKEMQARDLKKKQTAADDEDARAVRERREKHIIDNLSN